MAWRCSGASSEDAATCSSLGPLLAPPLEPLGAPARSTRASARRSKSIHGASGGAASISARQVAAACAPAPRPRGGGGLDQCAPSGSGLRAIAVLLGCKPQEVARLHTVCIECDRLFERSLRLRRHDPVGGEHQRLAERRFAFSRGA